MLCVGGCWHIRFSNQRVQPTRLHSVSQVCGSNFWNSKIREAPCLQDMVLLSFSLVAFDLSTEEARRDMHWGQFHGCLVVRSCGQACAKPWLISSRTFLELDVVRNELACLQAHSFGSRSTVVPWNATSLCPGLLLRKACAGLSCNRDGTRSRPLNVHEHADWCTHL